MKITKILTIFTLLIGVNSISQAMEKLPEINRHNFKPTRSQHYLNHNFNSITKAFTTLTLFGKKWIDPIKNGGENVFESNIEKGAALYNPDTNTLLKEYQNNNATEKDKRNGGMYLGNNNLLHSKNVNDSENTTNQSKRQKMKIQSYSNNIVESLRELNKVSYSGDVKKKQKDDRKLLSKNVSNNCTGLKQDPLNNNDNLSKKYANKETNLKKKYLEHTVTDKYFSKRNNKTIQIPKLNTEVLYLDTDRDKVNKQQNVVYTNQIGTMDDINQSIINIIDDSTVSRSTIKEMNGIIDDYNKIVTELNRAKTERNQCNKKGQDYLEKLLQILSGRNNTINNKTPNKRRIIAMLNRNYPIIESIRLSNTVNQDDNKKYQQEIDEMKDQQELGQKRQANHQRTEGETTSDAIKDSKKQSHKILFAKRLTILKNIDLSTNSKNSTSKITYNKTKHNEQKELAKQNQKIPFTTSLRTLVNRKLLTASQNDTSKLKKSRNYNTGVLSNLTKSISSNSHLKTDNTKSIIGNNNLSNSIEDKKNSYKTVNEIIKKNIPIRIVTHTTATNINEVLHQSVTPNGGYKSQLLLLNKGNNTHIKINSDLNEQNGLIYSKPHLTNIRQSSKKDNMKNNLRCGLGSMIIKTTYNDEIQKSMQPTTGDNWPVQKSTVTIPDTGQSQLFCNNKFETHGDLLTGNYNNGNRQIRTRLIKNKNKNMIMPSDSNQQNSYGKVKVRLNGFFTRNNTLSMLNSDTIKSGTYTTNQEQWQPISTLRKTTIKVNQNVLKYSKSNIKQKQINKTTNK